MNETRFTKIDYIKVLRVVFCLGLRDAKHIVDALYRANVLKETSDNGWATLADFSNIIRILTPKMAALTDALAHYSEFDGTDFVCLYDELTCIAIRDDNGVTCDLTFVFHPVTPKSLEI